MGYKTFAQLERENKSQKDMIFWLTIALIAVTAFMILFAELYLGRI